jgi:hypothetical protein
MAVPSGAGAFSPVSIVLGSFGQNLVNGYAPIKGHAGYAVDHRTSYSVYFAFYTATTKSR